MQAAEDLTHDALLYYWENKHKLPADADVLGYILESVKNKCLNYLKHIQVEVEYSKNRTELHDWEIVTRIQTLEDESYSTIFSKDIMKIVMESLSELPEQTRHIFVLNRLEYKSRKEIAVTLGVSQQKVDYHINKANDHLRLKLKDYILRWQEVYDKNQSRPTTYAAHGYIFKNHILPGLGDIPLSELTVEQVGDFLEERKRFGGHRPESPEYPGLGEHTMRHIHRLLQQCLDQAMRDGLITENPARAFHYPKPKKVSANVLTPAEVEDYLDAAEWLDYLPIFLLALTAGLRQGELIVLKYSAATNVSNFPPLNSPLSCLSC